MKKTLLITLALLSVTRIHAELFTEQFKNGVVKPEIE